MTQDSLKATVLDAPTFPTAQGQGALFLGDDRALRAEAIGLWAGSLALTELGLGSFLHAFHVPLTGTMLSLNQGFFLSRIIRINRVRPNVKRLGFEVSSVTALIKSFSPIGKRLTPMLAIASQGLLFTVGVSVFGVNILGVIVGSILLASWGIIQPIILAGVMFSAISEDARQKIMAGWTKMIGEVDFFTHVSLIDAIIVLLAIKCVIATFLAMVAWKAGSAIPTGFWNNLESAINRHMNSLPATKTNVGQLETPVKFTTQMTLALRDLKNPFIWLSLMMMVVPAFFLDSDFAPAIWISMRALAGIYAFYLVLRILPWDKLLNPSNERTAALRAAIRVIKGHPQTHLRVNTVSESFREQHK